MNNLIFKLKQKVLLGSITVAAALAVTALPATADTTTMPKKSIVQMSCKDYVSMDDVFKPKFIYYTVGYSKHGNPKATAIDVEGVEKIKPVVDEYCREHLTASAFKKIMAESMASEKMAPK